METLAVINATRNSPYASEPFAGGKSAIERVFAVAEAKASPQSVLVLTGPEGIFMLPALSGARIERRDSWSMASVIAAMKAFAEEKPGAALVYMQGDSPFTDPALVDLLLDLHSRYRAEYTFADGYPPGFATEIVAARSLPNLAELAGRHDAPSDRDGLFAVIQKDINSYDIETHLAPVDLRSYRFMPVCDTKRNFLAAERLWALGCRNADDVTRVLPANLKLLRTQPAFMWIQIVEACPQACTYCPYPEMVGDPRKLEGAMPVDRFASLMDQAEALCDDLVVDVSLWGEPSLHPEFGAIVEAAMKKPNFTMIVETSGIGWRKGLAERLAERWGDRIQWIVSLDDADPSGYSALRGEGQDEATAFAERMISAAAGRIHVQAVRMRENEARLEAFYRGWKRRTDKVIIQKYDSFAACLPDRSVAELSPLSRMPCRHLARDVAVLIDGSVPMCKHSLSRRRDDSSGRLRYQAVAGNVFDEGLAKAWDGIGEWYEAHLASSYPEPCGACDEYHTFNA